MLLPESPVGTRAALCTAIALAAAYAAQAVLAAADVHAFFSVWVYNSVELLAIAVVVSRVALRRGERAVWGLIAAGMALTLSGDLVFTYLYSNDAPIPSAADALYILSYVPLAAGLFLFARRHTPRVRSWLWLDGLIGALAIATLSSSLVIEPVVEGSASAPLAELVTNLAYPVCDIVLAGLVVGAVALNQWRVSRLFGALAAAMLCFAASDSVYLIQSARGTYVDGGLLDIGWLVAALLLATAAWLPGVSADRAHAPARGTLLAPACFGALALAVLLDEALTDGTPLSVALAGACMAVVLLRMANTYADNQRLLRASRVDAATDALTGLANRRRLLADLERVAHREREPTVLVLCDLDGFKDYNDTFGHNAGDELLRMIGASLLKAVDGRGAAYRMGGDEFCVLVPLAGAPAASLAEEIAAALVQRGEGFSVGASYGAVVVPEETTDATDALGLADRRMYERKHRRRISPGTQMVDVLTAMLSERNPALGEHLSDVTVFAAAVARRLGLGGAALRDVRLAAALHDTGKVAIPDDVLAKRGPLDETEWALMRTHTLIGQRVLSAAPSLVNIGRIVRSSHERWDGQGYPDGLRGDDIPLGSRIVFVCDAYDAMRSDRPYDAGRTAEAALAELQRCAGTQFDAAVVAALADELAEHEDARGDRAPISRSEPSRSSAPAPARAR